MAIRPIKTLQYEASDTPSIVNGLPSRGVIPTRPRIESETLPTRLRSALRRASSPPIQADEGDVAHEARCQRQTRFANAAPLPVLDLASPVGYSRSDVIDLRKRSGLR